MQYKVKRLVKERMAKKKKKELSQKLLNPLRRQSVVKQEGNVEASAH